MAGPAEEAGGRAYDYGDPPAAGVAHFQTRLHKLERAGYRVVPRQGRGVCTFARVHAVDVGLPRGAGVGRVPRGGSGSRRHRPGTGSPGKAKSDCKDGGGQDNLRCENQGEPDGPLPQASVRPQYT